MAINLEKHEKKKIWKNYITQNINQLKLKDQQIYFIFIDYYKFIILLLKTMIIKTDHSHHKNQINSQNSQEEVMINSSLCPLFLIEKLNETSKLLSQKSTQQIKNLVIFRNDKVYQSLTSQQSNYLALLFKNYTQDNQDYIHGLMSQRESQIMKKIQNEEYQIKSKKNQLKRIKSELDDKLKQVRNQLKEIDDDQLIKSQLRQYHANQFRKRKYWEDKDFNDHGKKVIQFLHRVKQQKHQNQARYNQSMDRQSKKHDEAEQRKQKQIQQQKRKEYLKILQKQKKNTEKRKKYFKEKQIKIKNVQEFLTKYKHNKPIYQKYEDQFTKQIAKIEAQRLKVLEQIKKSKTSYNPEDIEQHQSKYMELKQRKREEIQKKAEIQYQMQEKIKQDLNQLYHGRFHQKIKQQQNPISKSLMDLTDTRKKVMEYAKTVKQQIKPAVDKRKRQKVLETIKLLQNTSDPTKRKVFKPGGQFEFVQKKQNDSYQKGVSYLQELRIFNQGKSRVTQSDRSNSAMDVSKVKRIDYLRQERPSIKLKPTLSDWKNILTKKSMTPRDRYLSVMDRAQSLQIHAKQTQKLLRNIKNQNYKDVMDVKQESDKYYLESVAARMVVLKDLMQK